MDVRGAPPVQQPYVLALCALNLLAPVRADADLQAKVGPGAPLAPLPLPFWVLPFLPLPFGEPGSRCSHCRGGWFPGVAS